MSAVWSWVKSWWDYSRTVFINVAAALLALGGEFIPLLLGFDWSLFASPKASALIVLALSAVNVVLRFQTTKPVGGDGK